MKTQQGFSAVELLIGITVTLILMAGAMSAFNSSMDLNDKATLMADLEQNLRAGMNMLIQDFMSAGWNIPTGGIPIPSGLGAVPVVRPGPPGSNLTFNTLNVAAVNPGAGLGPVGFGQATDIVNILFADSTLSLEDSPLDAIAFDGSSATVNASTPITGVRNEIRAGDLIAFSNALGNTLQYVTRVSGQQMFFQPGDPMNLNQPNASQGSITQIKNPGGFPPTTAMRVWLISYYLDYTTDANTPRLIRRVNNRGGNAVALVLEDLQLTYDLVDGVINPTDVDTPVAPNSPNQIRKVNLHLLGRSHGTIRNTGEFLRRSLTTQVSLRSLSFIDRYI
ncbi:MAG: prepilin-type N-terminal cleavage/methylation domain-containing protein [Acidobacteria bacterium]|nr:prepilin-type N-terminal cleavage/methylation domain-containing protein [Acidobacteriota bacterium]